ncbi:hypothetical protein [Pseudoalteromonas denitrificans]|uniref:Phage protein n=1 Tax=Pseudoalteromonas denitrificans DSM 6059 TaxID=1123010 RepID=A0A1I1Q3E1_9GAMM|nr:hypothetical protein [Pseudoalteromonas denitrificans]SFD16507.1 hypothetical protein SAMN02745724_03716 [Pseudoalteromonas denitrificans DSM 6059]
MLKINGHTVYDLDALFDIETGEPVIEGKVVGYGKYKQVNATSVSQAKYQIACLEVHQLRKQAYLKESDPLYMEFQFDKTPESEQAWRDAVNDIKSRYPTPLV